MVKTVSEFSFGRGFIRLRFIIAQGWMRILHGRAVGQIPLLRREPDEDNGGSRQGLAAREGLWRKSKCCSGTTAA